MRKLSEIKNEDAVVVLSKILNPVMTICADKGFEKVWGSQNVIALVEYVCGNHPKQIIDILAALEGTPRDKYEANLVEIPQSVWTMFNDKAMLDFFQSQGIKISGVSFGSATVNTTETETK